MRYTGESNVPGAAGNVGVFTANTNPLLDPRFKIQGGEPWNRTPLLPGKDTKEYEQRQFNIPMQPRLPSAAIGNVGGLLAQALPTAPQGLSGFQNVLNQQEQQSNQRWLNKKMGTKPAEYPTAPGGPPQQVMGGAGAMGGASALGGAMGMGPKFGAQPFNLDIKGVDQRLESIGGSANIQLDPNQTLRIGGAFNPSFRDETGMEVPQSYSIDAQYQTPGIGINASYRNTGRMQGAGFPGQMQAGFTGRF